MGEKYLERYNKYFKTPSFTNWICGTRSLSECIRRTGARWSEKYAASDKQRGQNGAEKAERIIRVQGYVPDMRAPKAQPIIYCNFHHLLVKRRFRA